MFQLQLLTHPLTMRFTLLASLCGLLGVVSAAPTDLSATNTTPTTTTWNPTDPLPQAANDHSSGCRTNAECLRDNMPLRKPVRRARKAAMARRSAVAAQNFYLAVHNANTNAFMGYINKSPAYNVYSYYASVRFFDVPPWIVSEIRIRTPPLKISRPRQPTTPMRLHLPYRVETGLSRNSLWSWAQLPTQTRRTRIGHR